MADRSGSTKFPFGCVCWRGETEGLLSFLGWQHGNGCFFLLKQGPLRSFVDGAGRGEGGQAVEVSRVRRGLSVPSCPSRVYLLRGCKRMR